MSKFKIITMNINGINVPHKQNLLIHYLIVNHIDIAFLQDTRLSNISNLNLFKSKLKNYFTGVFSHCDNKSKGTAILVKNRIKILNSFSDTHGRITTCDLDFSNSIIRLISIYCPAKDSKSRAEFIPSIEEFLDIPYNIIIGGDFNFVEKDIDRIGSTKNELEKKIFKSLKETHNLIDIWRQLNPKKKEYTYHQNNSHSRLDRYYVTSELQKIISDATIEPSFLSDHSGVHLIIDFNKNSRPKQKHQQPWKMNCTILNDIDFLTDITSLILNLHAKNDIDWWEKMKKYIKKVAIQHSCRLQKERNNQFQTLLNDLKSAYLKNIEKPGEFTNDIENIKTKLKTLNEISMKGAFVRSRAELLTMELKPTRKFYQLERKRIQAKRITQITSNGRTLSDPDSIKQTIQTYYNDLYQKKYYNQKYSKNYIPLMSKLNSDQSKSLNEKISYKECMNILKSMPNNKAPGPDGIPVEFYKQFFPLIGHIFVRMINGCMNQKTLPNEFNHGLITLIPKTNNQTELKEINNWRPISLLNTDYKLFTKLLATRLQKFISSITDNKQTCGIKNRTIHIIILVASNYL